MRFLTILVFTATIALASFGANAQTTTTGAPTALPSFTYSLTEQSAAERQDLCNRNMGYCMNNCGGPDKAPKNFCNVTTMGWGCGCKDKIPDYQAYQWPINYANCACQSACKGDQSCIVACTKAYSSVCGTSDQPPAYYQVDDPSITPSYGPSKSGSSNAATSGSVGSTNPTSTPSSTNSTASDGTNVSPYSIIYPLAIVAAGMMML
ncbi:13628_t:CDS:2 [Acaulospora morrowiae]|uniref:13628_t:CDS:1 n=1 Tax=Acaulospora morrowiae TaxID=94023 RepID=A0A9N8ZFF0_9GLOM|nr:13628_t:CDS:2 [Acaulospora morrowiae]